MPVSMFHNKSLAANTLEPQDYADTMQSMVEEILFMLSHWQRLFQTKAISVIESMKDTEPAKEAIRYLTVSYNNPPTEKMFISIRDYLVARLEVENCQRLGPMETATLTEFQRAEKVNKKFAMKVARHKTSKGPA